MPSFFKIFMSRHVVINAFKIAVVVGSVLNLVNLRRKYTAWRYNLMA